MVLDPSSSEQTSLQNLLSNLSFNDANDNDALVNVRMFLSKIPSEKVYSLLTNNVLESFIRTTSVVTPGETLDLCREILDTVLLTIPPSHLLKRFHAEVLFALNSKSSMIKIAFLRSIRHAFESDSTTIDDVSTSNAPILIAVCRCLADSEVSVFQEAELTLISFAKSPKGPSILFNCNIVIETLKELLSCKDSVKRFRMHDFTADLCQISPEVLSYCDKAGFIQALLAEISSTDILGQLNALEILTNMASGNRHCLQYLNEKGVMNNLHEFLNRSQECPDSTFLFPAIMRLFGHLGRLYPKECIEKYPKFFDATFQLVINYSLMEVAQRLLAFDTLGLLASTPDGKMVLSKFDIQMERCMKCFGQCIREGPMEMRVRHLEALSDLLRLELTDQTPELLSLTEKWFSWLEKSPTELLFGIFKQPFDSIHCAAGEVFKRLAVQSWGQRAMFQQAGFAEYLLNRSAETTMEGRHTKFDIVDLLVNSPTINETVDISTVQRLQQYRNQGAYYVQGQLDVAMEEA